MKYRGRKTAPSVKLCNFHHQTQVIIQCSLYQVPNSDDVQRSPHSHKLVSKKGDSETNDNEPHSVEVSSRNDFLAE